MSFRFSDWYMEDAGENAAFIDDGIIGGELRDGFIEKCNPIETQFFDGLIAFDLEDPFFDIPFMFAFNGINYELTPQEKIEDTKYRADFMLMAFLDNPYNAIEIVIEIDGHAFHEKNKYQVAKDKQRERKIQSLGHPVIRFSGSEVYKDASKCWQEVFDIANQYLYGIMREKV